MKKLVAVMLAVALMLGICPAAMAKKNAQMNDDVPVWTEDTVREYALDYIEGTSMSRLWGYYDLQIRRYMPLASYEALLVDLEWMTGAFVGLGTYRYFEEPELQLKTHVLHLCMEKQDLDMYFTHKDKEDDWEVMAVEFVPAEKQDYYDENHLLVDGEPVAEEDRYQEIEITVGTQTYPLSGKLTMPLDASATNQVPACVLVHDEGALDMNSTLGQTAFFADLADALGNMGIAVIRYDKRSYAYPNATFETVREEVVEERRRDYKTLLQEHIQRKAGQELTYCMVREEGPDHAKTFVTEVQLNGAAIGEGSGHSKKESEQMAAKSALEKLTDK